MVMMVICVCCKCDVFGVTFVMVLNVLFRSACVDWYLFSFAAVDPTLAGEEGLEEEFTAGEDQGQPEPTGKPPFLYAYL